jgi:hypothetical protein
MKPRIALTIAFGAGVVVATLVGLIYLASQKERLVCFNEDIYRIRNSHIQPEPRGFK